MMYRIFVILFLLTSSLFLAGCLGNQEPNSPAPISEIPEQTVHQVISPEITSVPPLSVPSEKISEPKPDVKEETITPVQTLKSSSVTENAPDMNRFISTSFPQVTEIYSEIKKSRNALEWKEVQDKALKLQLLIQDLKKSYQLNIPNPEKKIFPGLDSRQQIVFLKYLQYLNDMENYATNLKNAVYYQEKGSDPQTSQASRRYQSLADQSEKQAIAEVKTISDYCIDFKYSFFDPILSGQYRYTG